MRAARSITMDIDIWQDIERFAQLDGLSLSKEVSRLIITSLNNRIEIERNNRMSEREADEVLEKEQNGKTDS